MDPHPTTLSTSSKLGLTLRGWGMLSLASTDPISTSVCGFQSRSEGQGRDFFDVQVFSFYPSYVSVRLGVRGMELRGNHP